VPGADFSTAPALRIAPLGKNYRQKTPGGGNTFHETFAAGRCAARSP